jgi:Predicted transcriptional regulators
MQCDFLTLADMCDATIDVAAIRKAKGWTQQRLAEHCGVDRSTISLWEKKPPKKGPGLVLLRQLQASLQEAAPEAAE